MRSRFAQAQVASEMQKSAVAKDSEIQALKAKMAAAELAEAILSSGLQNAAANRLAPRGLPPILKRKFSQISVTASRSKSAVIGRPRFSYAVMSSCACRAGFVQRARIFLMALSARISCNCNWFIKNSSGCCTSMQWVPTQPPESPWY